MGRELTYLERALSRIRAELPDRALAIAREAPVPMRIEIQGRDAFGLVQGERALLTAPAPPAWRVRLELDPALIDPLLAGQVSIHGSLERGLLDVWGSTEDLAALERTFRHFLVAAACSTGLASLAAQWRRHDH